MRAEDTMQVFVKGLCSLEAGPGITVAELKSLLEAKQGTPAGLQRLLYGGRQLEDGATLQASRVENGATLHLVLRLRGGKGGFGALLRGAGRAAQTDNVDACRDLSGRRLRHVNAEKKLKEWAAQAPQREKERVEKEAQRALEREARRQADKQVDISAFREQQEGCLKEVNSALLDGLKAAGANGVLPKLKRKAALENGNGQKKRRILGALDDDEDVSLDKDDSFESESDNEVLMGAVVSESRVAIIQSDEGSEGSAQDAVEPAVVVPAISQDVSCIQSQVASVGTARRPGTPSVSQDAGWGQDGAEGAESVYMAGIDTEATTAASKRAAKAEGSGALSSAVSGAEVAEGIEVVEGQGSVLAEPLDLSRFSSAEALEGVGLEVLKQELVQHGLKCGGTLAERAARLFLVRDTPLDKLDRKHFAKPSTKR